MKDQFLANTSHELRTPLHGIMNIARNIATKQKHAMDNEALEDLELLITVSRRMSHLLDDLLDIVRIKENRILLQKEPLPVQSVVSGVFGMLRFMAEGKPVQLKMDIDESMPPFWRMKSDSFRSCSICCITRSNLPKKGPFPFQPGF